MARYKDLTDDDFNYCLLAWLQNEQRKKRVLHFNIQSKDGEASRFT